MAGTVEEWGTDMGLMLSSALTTFLHIPTAAQVSLAMTLLFDGFGFQLKGTGAPSSDISNSLGNSDVIDARAGSWLSGPYRPLEPLYGELAYAGKVAAEPNTDNRDSRAMSKELITSVWEDLGRAYMLSVHPLTAYANFESDFLLGHTRTREAGHTEVSLSSIPRTSGAKAQLQSSTFQQVSSRYILSAAGSTPGQLGAAYATKMATVGYPRLVRCDILNMTRNVHHHYDYAKDGHKRTYTMRVEIDRNLTEAASSVFSPLGVKSLSAAHPFSLPSNGTLLSRKELPVAWREAALEKSLPVTEDVLIVPLNGVDSTSVFDALHLGKVHAKPGAEFALNLPLGFHPNNGQIVSVQLQRNTDSYPIPYTTIHGITLITAIRLGLEVTIRDRLFGNFLNLSLYEDMAPWNIVLMGRSLSYIDYDTRDLIFDKDVPKTYQLLSILMNYKRTVEDFKKCGSKANTVYGLPFMSDCIGSSVGRTLSCPDLKMPVPCGDGKCHSDYISCLRSLNREVENLALLSTTKATAKYAYSSSADKRFSVTGVARSSDFVVSPSASSSSFSASFNDIGPIK